MLKLLKAIIQNKTLWLSSVYNLNDYKENSLDKRKESFKKSKNNYKNNYEKFNTF